MLWRVLVIALNTYRESVRARILIGLAGVAFAVALYSLVVGAFTLQDAPRVVSDLGAASISIFSIAVAIVIAVTSLQRELEQKTIFPILARPIERAEFLVGKYCGILLTIAVFIAADAGLVLLLSALHGGQSPILITAIPFVLIAVLVVVALRYPKAWTFGPIPFAAALFAAGVALSSVAPTEQVVVLASCALTLLEVAIITAIATFFASFSTPFLSALFTLGLWIVGRNADALAKLPEKYVGAVIASLGAGVAKIVPNLQVYVPPRPLLLGEVADAPLVPYLGFAAGTSLAWAVGLLAAAAIVFKKRDFL